jgi:hypothetical protein
MQDEYKDKDLDGCTFHPQLMTHHGSDKRNLDKFLEDQKRFQEKIHKKIEDVKQHATKEEESIMHP